MVGVSTATVVDGDTILWYEGMTQNHFRAPTVKELDADAGDWTEISSADGLLRLAESTDKEAMAGKLPADRGYRHAGREIYRHRQRGSALYRHV